MSRLNTTKTGLIHNKGPPVRCLDLETSASYPNEGTPKASDDRCAVSITYPGHPIHWWRPFFVTRIAPSLLILVLVCIISVLEIVYQISKRNAGLMDGSPGRYVHYVYAFIPAFAMVLVGLASKALDTTTKIFAPFSALKRISTFRQSLDVNYLRETSLEALWTSFRRRHVAVFATTAAVVLSSYLTIVVSGVYTATAVPDTKTVALLPKTWFNATYDYQLSQNMPEAGALRSELILVANMSYPTWSYGELSFPSL